jgi:hypothetical protein
MGDAHGPGKEFSFFRIPSAADSINYADEDVLENIFREILVLDEQENGRVNFVFVTKDESLQGIGFTFYEKMNELLVGEVG